MLLHAAIVRVVRSRIELSCLPHVFCATNPVVCRSRQMKLITASGLVERLKVNGSLARAAIRELEEKGLIRKVDAHHAQVIYTRATNVEE